MGQADRHRKSARRLSFRAAVAALAVGGLGFSSVVVNAASATSRHRAASVVVSATTNAQLGTILVSGKTLYTLKASTTPCTAQCLKTWPELLLPKGVTKAKAGTGVNASKLGTVKRAHGALQVTYAGKALYWFSLDTAAGQVNGNVTDAWGKWSDVVTAKPAVASNPSASNTPAVPAPSPTAGTSPPMTSPPPPRIPVTSPPPPPPPPPPTPPTTAPGSGGVSF